MGRYSHINFKPPEAVANAAARGLELRKKHGKGGLTPKQASKQGIGSGVSRASSLKSRTNISPKVIKQMTAFFSRHAKNKSGGPDDAGYISWQLWGGDAGKAWANKVRDQMDAADKKSEAMIRKNASMIMDDVVRGAFEGHDAASLLEFMLTDWDEAGEDARILNEEHFPNGKCSFMRLTESSLLKVAWDRLPGKVKSKIDMARLKKFVAAMERGESLEFAAKEARLTTAAAVELMSSLEKMELL